MVLIWKYIVVVCYNLINVFCMRNVYIVVFVVVKVKIVFKVLVDLNDECLFYYLFLVDFWDL